jgi:hypothetical protein
MIYRFALTETEAQEIARHERLLGRRAYILQLRADYFEIRSWK